MKISAHHNYNDDVNVMTWTQKSHFQLRLITDVY